MSNKIQRVTVKALIIKNEKVLLVKDHQGVWEMPGGKIIFNESPEIAIERELKEELNLNNIKIGNIVDCWSFVTEKNETKYQFIVLVYSVKVSSKNIRISDEHTEFEWLSLEELKDITIKDGYKKSIAKYLMGIR